MPLGVKFGDEMSIVPYVSRHIKTPLFFFWNQFGRNSWINLLPKQDIRYEGCYYISYFLKLFFLILSHLSLDYSAK